LHSHGAGNNELESYTPSNAHVERGKLIIEAQKNMNGSIATYSSSKIVSRGKADFGIVKVYVDDEDEDAESSEALTRSRRFEAKLKLPWGHGIWPAFWMLPSFDLYGGWPKVGPLFHARSSPWC
jgi:beta-glucanase (GH16 family)